MKTIFVALVTCMIMSTFSCAPVFSELQSAKLVGKGNFEIVPQFTTASVTGDNHTNHVQNHYGFQVGYGISNRFDIRTRIEHIGLTNGRGSANVFAVGPKLSLVKDKIALYFPVGFAFGGDLDGIKEFEAQPTILFTFPIWKYIEINPSAKALIGEEFVGEKFLGEEYYVGFNLGLGLSTDFKKYVIRPEYGILFRPGEEGHFGQFSIGTSIYLSKGLLKSNKKQ